MRSVCRSRRAEEGTPDGAGGTANAEHSLFGMDADAGCGGAHGLGAWSGGGGDPAERSAGRHAQRASRSAWRHAPGASRSAGRHAQRASRSTWRHAQRASRSAGRHAPGASRSAMSTAPTQEDVHGREHSTWTRRTATARRGPDGQEPARMLDGGRDGRREAQRDQARIAVRVVRGSRDRNPFRSRDCGQRELMHSIKGAAGAHQTGSTYRIRGAHGPASHTVASRPTYLNMAIRAPNSCRSRRTRPASSIRQDSENSEPYSPERK